MKRSTFNGRKRRNGKGIKKTTVEHRLRLERFKRAHFRSKRREENCSIQAQARIRVLNVYEYESSFNKFKPPETNLNGRERKGKQRKKKKKGIGRRREFTKHGRTAIMQTLIIQILGCLNCSTIWMPVPSKPNLQQLEFLEKCSFNSSDSTFIDSANWQHRLLSWIESKKCYNISMCIYAYIWSCSTNLSSWPITFIASIVTRLKRFEKYIPFFFLEETR